MITAESTFANLLTYFQHQLAGAYEHVGSTEVDCEFTNDGKALCSTTLSQPEIIYRGIGSGGT